MRAAMSNAPLHFRDPSRLSCEFLPDVAHKRSDAGAQRVVDDAGGSAGVMKKNELGIEGAAGYAPLMTRQRGQRPSGFG
jgi:hypothetical protein